MLYNDYIMRAYSVDLRQRIVAAVLSGQTQRQVAERFDVSLPTVQRYVGLHRDQANLAPKRHPGRKPIFDADQQQQLRALMQQQPDRTVQSLVEAWKDKTGATVAWSTLHLTLHRMGFSFKKEPGRCRTLLRKA